jgi:hypothetical protein
MACCGYQYRQLAVDILPSIYLMVDVRMFRACVRPLARLFRSRRCDYILEFSGRLSSVAFQPAERRELHLQRAAEVSLLLSSPPTRLLLWTALSLVH